MKLFRGELHIRQLSNEEQEALRAEVGEGDIFVFLAEVSNSRLDGHYSHMDVSSLLNFATDATSGVPFQDSHSTSKLGYAYSFKGIFDSVQQRTEAWFYTVPGISFNNLTFRSTDEFVKGVRTRLVRKVSVGYGGNDCREVCDICGSDMWGWFTDCPHYPGFQYEIEGSSRLATYTIFDASLYEVSGVYAGSTPGAEVLNKFSGMLERGLVTPKLRGKLQQRFRALTFPEITNKSWQGVKYMPKDEKTTERGQALRDLLVSAAEGMAQDMVTDDLTFDEALAQVYEGMANAAGIEVSTLRQAKQPIRQIIQEDSDGRIDCPPMERLEGFAGYLDGVTLDELVAAWEADGCGTGEDETRSRAIGRMLEQAGISHAEGIEAAIRELLNERDTLRPLAEIGKQYKTELIKAALSEGVRVMGNDFDKKTFEPLLQNSQPDQIKAMRDGWQRAADILFKQGRRTTEASESRDSRNSPIPDDPHYEGD